MRLSYHLYELAFAGNHLGSVAMNLPRAGALLKIKFEAIETSGYACIQPWPELGDKPLVEQLDLLSSEQSTPLIKQALNCAYADALARNEAQSLSISNTLKNHALCELLDPNIVTTLQNKQQLGFDTIKIKVGNDWARERQVWQQLAPQFPQLKWRLDFNERLNWEDLSQTLTWLKQEKLDSFIDFLEDPVSTRLNLKHLIGYTNSISIAIDRDILLLSQLNSDYFLGVIKPAIDEPPLIKSLLKANYQLCFTSYLDHPLGQAWAMHQASYWQQKYPNQLLTGGLLSQSSYQSSPFSNFLSTTPYGNTIKGFGLGFNQLLESLSWTPLNG